MAFRKLDTFHFTSIKQSNIARKANAAILISLALKIWNYQHNCFYAKLLNVEIEEGAGEEIARRCRGTPRIANRLLRRVRDYAEVRADGRITKTVAQKALDLLDVDRYGLDEIDQKIMMTILEKYRGGPVGVNTIAASISEEAETIEEVYEPYLIQLGFLNRTPRGRVATELAYEYFKVKRKLRDGEQPALF